MWPFRLEWPFILNPFILAPQGSPLSRQLLHPIRRLLCLQRRFHYHPVYGLQLM